jgi:hypothetical protein
MFSGKVDSEASRKAAEDIGKKFDGVKSVTNGLEVVAPSSREAVEEKDEAITASSKTDLLHCLPYSHSLRSRLCLENAEKTYSRGR